MHSSSARLILSPRDRDHGHGHGHGQRNTAGTPDGSWSRLFDRHRPDDPPKDRVGRPEIRLSDPGTELIGPRLLGSSDPAKRGAASARDPDQLRSPVIGVVLIRGEALVRQQVGHPLHALAGEPPGPGDLRHRQGGRLDRRQHPPPRARLAGGLGHRVAGRGEQPVQPEDVDHELTHGVAGLGPFRPAPGVRLDSILSSRYRRFRHDNSLSYLADRRPQRGRGSPMTDTTKGSGAEIQPFWVDVSQADLDDLDARLVATRFTDEIPGSGSDYGVSVEWVRRMVEYWRDGYDWRTWERRLNAHPQFTTEIDAQNIHFMHVRSTDEAALPLILTHGWPGTVVEYLDVIDDLSRDFHLVIPSLPGFGFSGPTKERGWNRYRMARAWAELMRRLGYNRYGAVGNDAGSFVSPEVGRVDPEHVVGVHVTQIFSFPSGDPPELEELSEDE